MSQQEIDQNYQKLTEIYWEGIGTKKIEWAREGNKALATFGWFEDATGFVHGFLDGVVFKAIKYQDTEESIALRGTLREEFLPKKSMADQIEIPNRQPWGTPVTIKIPLEIIDTNGLQQILDSQTRRGLKKPVAESAVPGQDSPV
ncbi:MAG: hypothetical protein IT558_02040 [Alphaproteobacteria bacterium]|nr:hypothetical protein [Alphaproteobacteria bacterium]